MREIKLTQNQVALVDDVDYKYLMKWKWYAEKCRGRNFRAKRSKYIPNECGTSVYIHRVIAKRMGINARQIDHRDRNPLNNQRSNLREATGSQNGHNRGSPKKSVTGVKGIDLHKASGKYRARIGYQMQRYSLGYFDTIEEAATVVRKKREELVGEFACH